MVLWIVYGFRFRANGGILSGGLKLGSKKADDAEQRT
jgi:hypothetical protein